MCKYDSRLSKRLLLRQFSIFDTEILKGKVIGNVIVIEKVHCCFTDSIVERLNEPPALPFLRAW